MFKGETKWPIYKHSVLKNWNQHHNCLIPVLYLSYDKIPSRYISIWYHNHLPQTGGPQSKHCNNKMFPYVWSTNGNLTWHCNWGPCIIGHNSAVFCYKEKPYSHVYKQAMQVNCWSKYMASDALCLACYCLSLASP